MRCSTTFILIALSSLNALVVDCAPFTPGDGSLQRHRRRAVDYPLQHEQQAAAHRLGRRDLPYSVVQVDGDAQDAVTIVSTQPAATLPVSTVPVTVTDVSSIIETLTVTTTISGTPTPLTITQTVQAPAVTNIVFEPVTETLPAITLTAIAPTTAAPVPATTPIIIYETVVKTATASSVQYYDDGMWHTYYPIKQTTWTTATPTPSSTILSTLPATAVAALHKRGRQDTSSGAKVARHASSKVQVIGWPLTHTEEEGLRRFS